MALRTKWDILSSQLSTLDSEASLLRRDMDDMNRTAINTACIKCGEPLATEGDFARHFLVIDEQYLNIGRCPR